LLINAECVRCSRGRTKPRHPISSPNSLVQNQRPHATNPRSGRKFTCPSAVQPGVGCPATRAASRATMNSSNGERAPTASQVQEGRRMPGEAISLWPTW
jgi:hypothetical protein